MLSDRERLRQFIALNEAILRGASDDALLRLVVEKTMTCAPARACALLTAAGGYATVAASAGVDPRKVRGFAEPLDERIGDALRRLLDIGETDALMCAPLLRCNGITGLLAIRVAAPRSRAESRPASLLLSALADQASLALEYARHRRARDEAEAALKVSQAELRQQAESLAAADLRKNEFLSMLAHELRNPLAPVLFGVETLRVQLPEHPGVRRVHAIVQRQVKQMSRLLDDLLDVARITRGKIELRLQPISVNVALARAAQAAQTALEAQQHALKVEPLAEDLWVRADPDRLEQILCNLLNNSAKYTDPGGHVWLSAVREGQTVLLQVRDDGMGITPELLPHVFELFTQGPQTVERSQGGLGIGLTLVEQLVALHGGSVEAHSGGAGQGSVFSVRLPIMAVMASVPIAGRGSEQPAPTASSGGPLRVLVVEDNLDMAAALAMLLRLHGHEVEMVHDGSAALATAGSYRPDVVLLDLGLPGLDGYEVARRLRAELHPHPPLLVAMTGYGQEEDRRRSAAAGCDHHLVKPVQFAEIERLLASRR